MLVASGGSDDGDVKPQKLGWIRRSVIASREIWLEIV
jgi:hypothetical protein